VVTAGAARAHRKRPGAPRPAGVVEQGIGTRGHPGTWEIPSFPRESGPGLPQSKTPGPARGAGVPGRHERRRNTWYRQAKEDEARRDGRREVAAP
jgi:hypothetical protein